MRTAKLPSVFLSHGPPSLLLQDDPTTAFLSSLAETLPTRPSAVLVMSAHWETRGLMITTRAKQSAMYDFHGFPQALYAMRYEPMGNAGLASTVTDRLSKAGFLVTSDPNRILDHGVWMPLKLIYPQTDIPVVQLSLPVEAGPEDLLAIGHKLAFLRDEGVLILGSGNMTHNLQEAIQRFRYGNSGVPDWVSRFQEMAEAALVEGDPEALVAALTSPEGRQNHPSAEHFLPIFFAMGAGGTGPARKCHAGVCHDVLAMDAYTFG